MAQLRRFFVRAETGDRIDAERSSVILVSEFNHISRVLRLKKDDLAIVCDKDGTEYICRVAEFADGAVRLNIVGTQKNGMGPVMNVTLFFGALKGANTAFVVQKAVELGAARIVPFIGAHTISNVDAKKAAHLSSVALEACKQCGRAMVPALCEAVPFAGLLKELTAFKRQNVLFCYEKGGTAIADALKNINKGEKIGVIIGSEGGFSAAEAEQLAAVAEKVSLTNRILRAETASVFALAVIDALLNT